MGHFVPVSSPSRRAGVPTGPAWLLGVLVSATALLAAGEAPPLPGLEDIPAIVAEVNGVPISRHDLIRELVGSSATDAFDRVARRALVEQAAKKDGVTITAEEIEQQLTQDRIALNKELIREYPDLNREFPLAEIIRARFRMSLDEYKALVIRQRLLTRRCVAKDMAAPTEQALTQFFEAQQTLFRGRVEYRASHILITPFDPRDLMRGFRYRKPLSQMAQVAAERQRRMNLYKDYGIEPDADLNSTDLQKDPAWQKFKLANPNVEPGAPSVDQLDAAWRKTEEDARRVLAEIKAGRITWDQAVRKHTQDPADHARSWEDGKKQSERERARLAPGDVYWFHADGPVVKEFYEGVKHLKPGEIGGPVRTQFGYHLVKMIEVREPPPVTFAQRRAEVEEVYVGQELLARAEVWLERLVDEAKVRLNRSALWPPPTAEKAAAEGDLSVGTVNEAPVKRSELWRELLRSDGEEALTKLVHFEIVMTLLKQMGLERLEWESSDPGRRAPNPPPARPMNVSAEALELELNTDRLQKDREAQELSLEEYLQRRYGQGLADYKKKLEAGLILRAAVRRRVPVDNDTLRVQFALARHLYSEPPWYEVSHILIKPTGGAEADNSARLQAKLVADQVWRMCKARPEDFGKLVAEYSMDTAENKALGGVLGHCYPDARRGTFREGPAIYKEICKQHLQRGQISTPIATPRGVHIVRVDAAHPEVRAEFEQVKDRVERDYLQERAKMHTDLWLRSLVSQARIKRHLFQSTAPILENLPPDNFRPPRDK